MTMWLALLACSTAPTVPEGPQEDVAKAAAKNLCKLYKGGGLTCSVDGTSVTAEGQRITASATYDQYDDTLGVITFKGTVALAVDGGDTWTTRMSGYGSGKGAAIERGLHEWALVSGTAFVDALRHDGDRKALKAVEPTIGHEIYIANATAVWPGWTLQRPPLEGGMGHEDLLARIAPVVPKLGPPPHMLRIEAARNLGELVLTCYVDGVPAPDVCAATKGYHWPDVGSFEARQSYAVFGDPIAPPPPSAEGDDAAPVLPEGG